MERLNIDITYEITITNEEVNKKPTLDFDEKDVERISKKIAKDVSKLPKRNKR
jgi:uncharacterized metal-binding protein